jgi:hypothetical protein
LLLAMDTTSKTNSQSQTNKHHHWMSTPFRINNINDDSCDVTTQSLLPVDPACHLSIAVDFIVLCGCWWCEVVLCTEFCCLLVWLSACAFGCSVLWCCCGGWLGVLCVWDFVRCRVGLLFVCVCVCVCLFGLCIHCSGWMRWLLIVVGTFMNDIYLSCGGVCNTCFGLWCVVNHMLRAVV